MNSTYTFVLLGLAIFANGWITWYFAYFKKIGEFQAIKENVDEITKITERIKHDFDIIKQNQIGLKSEQRRVVIQYYKVIYEIINKLPSVRVMMFARSSDVKDFTKGTKTSLMFAEAELLLFVSDERVRNGSKILRELVEEICKELDDRTYTLQYPPEDFVIDSKAYFKEVFDYVESRVDILKQFGDTLQQVFREILIAERV